jgi:hypothetical protein
LSVGGFLTVIRHADVAFRCLLRFVFHFRLLVSVTSAGSGSYRKMQCTFPVFASQTCMIAASGHRLGLGCFTEIGIVRHAPNVHAKIRATSG